MRVNGQRREADQIWADLERGERVGGSYWTDIVRDAATDEVKRLSVPSFGITKNPSWGRVSNDKKHDPEPGGSWVVDYGLCPPPLLVARPVFLRGR